MMLRRLVATTWRTRKVSGNLTRYFSTSESNADDDSDSGMMQDEYGVMDDSGLTYTASDYVTEGGFTFPEARVRYKTWGTLNEERDNVMVVCHALTGNADVAGWWGDFLGPGKPFDTDKYFVVCANMVGSCYGSTGPTDIDPRTGRTYGGSFPQTTVRDSVRLHMQMLQEAHGVKQVACAVGGSLGGMQVMEWLCLGRDGFVKSGAPLACGAYHHAWQIAVSECQRQAIYADPNWCGGNYPSDSPPHAGLSVARQIAMISYRTHEAYEGKFARNLQGSGRTSPELGGGDEAHFSVEGYLRHQGKKFLSRFDPASYVRMTQTMDSHDIARDRPEGSAEAVLKTVHQPVLVVGVSSDVLYPVEEQQFLADHLPNATYHVIDSPEGHDGFLLEQTAICDLLQEFLADK